MFALSKTAARPVRMENVLLHDLDRELARHPVLALTAAMLLTGTGMVLAVTAGTVICTLPIALLMGWI